MTRRNLTFVLALAATAVCARAAIAQLKADRYYNIDHKTTGKFVYTESMGTLKDVKLGGPIAGGQEDQYAFKLIASREKGYFYLLHKASGKYLCTEANADARVHLYGPIPPQDEDRYLFKLFDAGEGYYYLLHKYSGRYLLSGWKDGGGAIGVFGPIPEGDQDLYKFRFTPATTAAGSGDRPGK